MSTISATVKTIQDVMRQDAGIDGDAQRIGQLAWMFFLKIFDDREAEAELLDDDYRSPIPSELRWRTWAAPKEGVTGDALLSFVNNELFPTLKQFAETSTSGRSSVIGNVFQDAFNYMKNGTLIRQVVNKINEIDFNRSEDRHLFGDIYEQILKDLQSAGNSGEYYTPRAVTQFMIDMVDPKLGETLLDPACGTGGFLTGAIEHVRANHVRTPDDEARLQGSIRGVEKKQLPHLLCTTNMLLHGVDVPTNIAHDNTLARPLRDYGSADRVDVIITNPPFGGTEEPGIENNFPQAFRTRETADLFLVLIQHLLRDGGRAAVVLPDGTLFGDGVKARIKEKLLTECNLHTVVRLPKGVFNPYTPTATNLLFFTKGRPTTDIWFFEHQYPPGYKSYSKTKPIRLEEFAAEKAWWHNRVESDVAWKVSIEDIKDGWNLDIANPNKLDAEHRDPAKLLKECDALLGEVEATRTSLRDSLADVVDDGYARTNRQTFIDSFGHIADAPDGIDKLRRLIRDLAVRGRLTRRDPDDEPVADLLAHIKDERDRRAATKEVRKQQHQVPDLPAADRPFALPSAWEWVRFGNICQSRLGKMLDEEKNSGTPRKYLRNANVQWDRFDLSEVKELRLEDGELGEYELLDGDLLVVEGGYPGRCAVWDSNLADGVMVFQKALHRVRPEAGISSRFIALVLRNAVDTGRILEFFTGSGIKHLTGKKLVAVPIPLPPIGEQRRIVERVAELYEICDLLEQQLRGAESLRGDLASSIAAHAIGSDTR